jgi:hypothetical protein
MKVSCSAGCGLEGVANIGTGQSWDPWNRNIEITCVCPGRIEIKDGDLECHEAAANVCFAGQQHSMSLYGEWNDHGIDAQKARGVSVPDPGE